MTRFGGALLRAAVNQALSPDTAAEVVLLATGAETSRCEGVRALRVADPLPGRKAAALAIAGRMTRRVSLAVNVVLVRGRGSGKIDEIINEK